MLKPHNSANTYKKLEDGTYGAWIYCGYGHDSLPKPNSGDQIKITTRSGAIHTRTIKDIVKEYASGVIVSLETDKSKTFASSENEKMCYRCGSYCYGDCTPND